MIKINLRLNICSYEEFVDSLYSGKDDKYRVIEHFSLYVRDEVKCSDITSIVSDNDAIRFIYRFLSQRNQDYNYLLQLIIANQFSFLHKMYCEELSDDSLYHYIAVRKCSQWFGYASARLKSDRQLCDIAIDRNPNIFICMPSHIRDSEYFAYKAVLVVPHMLRYVSFRLSENPELCLLALRNGAHPWIFTAFHFNLQYSKYFCYECLLINVKCFKYMRRFIRQNPELCLISIKDNYKMSKYIPATLQLDKKFCKKCLTLNPYCFLYMYLRVRNITSRCNIVLTDRPWLFLECSYALQHSYNKIKAILNYAPLVIIFTIGRFQNDFSLLSKVFNAKRLINLEHLRTEKCSMIHKYIKYGDMLNFIKTMYIRLREIYLQYYEYSNIDISS